MDCPLCVSGRQVGILRVTAEGRDTRFTVRASAPGGLYRLYARGERKDLLLGVWEGGAMSRRFSREMTAPAGRILGAEAYPVCRPEELWEPALPEQFPRWQVSGGLCRCRKNGRELALHVLCNAYFLQFIGTFLLEFSFPGNFISNNLFICF